jgi:hypothetical protein
VKDELGAWAVIPQGDLAIAFGIELALIADVEIFPGFIAVQEVEAIISDVQSLKSVAS